MHVDNWVGLLGLLGLGGLLRDALEARRTRAREHHELLRKRHDRIYVPLYAALAECSLVPVEEPLCHARVKGIVAAPFTRRERWRRAPAALLRGQVRLAVAIARARPVRLGADYDECSARFPFNEIRRCIEDNKERADSRLLDRLHRAARERMSREADSNAGDPLREADLSPGEWALIEHICEEYHRLNRRVVPKT